MFAGVGGKEDQLANIKKFTKNKISPLFCSISLHCFYFNSHLRKKTKRAVGCVEGVSKLSLPKWLLQLQLEQLKVGLIAVDK